MRTETLLATGLKYYTYDVQYLESIDRFLAVAVYEQGGGFAFLLDDSGTIVGQHLALPELVREAQPAIWRGDGPGTDRARVVYPKSDGGIMALDVTSNAMTLSAEIAGQPWQNAGADGIFTAANQVYFVNLSSRGLVERTFAIAP